MSCMLCGTEVYLLIYNTELPEGYQPRARRGAQHMGTASPVSLGSGSSDDCSDGSTPPEYDFNSRRRSRAVLYHLSGMFDKRQSAKSKLQLNKVSHYAKKANTHQLEAMLATLKYPISMS